MKIDCLPRGPYLGLENKTVDGVKRSGLGKKKRSYSDTSGTNVIRGRKLSEL